MQEMIIFECTVCKRRDYTSTKNKKKNPDRLSRSKYCYFCRQHTPHREYKK